LNLKKQEVNSETFIKRDNNIFVCTQVKFKFLNHSYPKISQVFLVCIKNIGLIPKTGPLPQNRKFWTRPTASMERNGMMNIHTPNFNTRAIYPLFFGVMLYGWWGHSTHGMYKAKYEVNDELPENMYDKLNTRVPPISKIWLRPG
jgi:hypothetical protein